ncbi:MAG: UvrB/UvrC motif-containing protein, partial [Actinomycetota bacterium]|nr:UvrB/UvrC motif-containing protein [Actinomycetota bacterium]
AGYGVTTLEDLLAVTRSRLDGTFAKVILADGLPHGIGVYRFVGARGNTLYIGKATDIRRRVRSYFYGDPRRKIRDLLRETQSIEVQQHASMLEAEIAEACAIATELPPYNSSGKNHAAWYVRIVTRAKVPKVAAARGRRPDGSIYLGPFSARIARALIDTFRDALALHRCSRPERCRGCAFGEMGTCAGTDPAAHRREMAALAASVLTEPDRILDPLLQRMHKLASQERFEEAAELRERAAVLERLLHRDLETRALVDAGDVVVASGGRAILLRAGRVSAATDTTDRDDDEVVAALMTAAGAQEGMAFAGVEEHRQAPIISAWLRRAPDVRLLHATGIWAHPAAARPAWRFRPVHTEAATSTRRSRARAERPESIASAAI